MRKADRQRVRVEAPDGLSRVEVAQAVSQAIGANAGRERIRVETEEGGSRLAMAEAIAQAVAGDGVLIKAEPRYGERTFSRHRAMRDLNADLVSAYEALLDKMLLEVRLYVEKHVLGAELRKAELTEAEQTHGFVAHVDWPSDEEIANPEDVTDSPYSPRRFLTDRAMSLLTPSQLERIKEIIREYHEAFAVGTLGPDVLPAEVVQRLIDTGVIPSDLKYVWQPAPYELPPVSMRFTDEAYLYGTYLGKPRERRVVMQMGRSQFVMHQEKTAPPLSPVEKQAMAWARHSAGHHIRGMGDRISLQTGLLIIQGDGEQRRRYLGVVRKELEENIDKRAAWRDLASKIGHATGDWSRDLQRVAATEQQWAMQEGNARSMAKGRDPDSVRVAKIPTPTACPDCVRLHLTSGPGSPPRIFDLSDLQANGTNVGRKRGAWKAVIGPIHPWCSCELIEVPEGWDFDEEGNLAPEIMLRRPRKKKGSGDQGGSIVGSMSKGEGDVRPHMTHQDAVPEDTCIVRIGDPKMRAVVEAVVASAPPEIFHKDVGVTLITTDTPRAQNPLDEHDFAYWTANEIRIMQTLDIERVPRVIRHELGHSLNVHLMNTLGSVDKVRTWHDDLWAVSMREGFVSDYAMKLPIENAAEVTRMYIFERSALMLKHPQQFAFCHRAYRAIFRKKR